MVSKKKTTRNRLLIGTVAFLALPSQTSFSQVELETEGSVSVENQSVNPIKLYTIRLHHKNKSSENLVYASFDNKEQKYVVICQSVGEQYRDAPEKCDTLKKDSNLGTAIKSAGFRRNTIDFRASKYRNQNKFWKLVSYFYKHYPVNIDALLPKQVSGDRLAEKKYGQTVPDSPAKKSDFASFTNPYANDIKTELYDSDDEITTQKDRTNIAESYDKELKGIAFSSIGLGLGSLAYKFYNQNNNRQASEVDFNETSTVPPGRITIKEEVPDEYRPKKSCLDRVCFREPRIKDSYNIIRETFGEQFVSYVFKDSADTADSAIVETHASFDQSTPWFDISLFSPGKGQGGYIAFYAPHGKILWADVRDIGINSIPHEMVTGRSKHRTPSYRLSPLYENIRDNNKSVAQSMVDRRIISEDSRNTMFVTMDPEAGKSTLLDILDELTLKYPEVQQIHLNICRSFRGGQINFHDFLYLRL